MSITATSFDSPSPPRDVIDSEHRSIHRALARLHESLEGLDPTAPEPKLFRRVVVDLDALLSLLERHFEREEANRYYGRIRSALPEASSELQRLSEEHASILQHIRDARAQARHCSPVQAEILRESLEAVFELLRLHELAESELMVEATSGSDESRGT